MKHCPGSVCYAARQDGITCADDSCDFETGVREPVVGGYGQVHPSIANKLMNLLREQEVYQEFNNGTTATFWHVIATLNNHLDKNNGHDEKTVGDE